jgi:hypothetical protein
MRLQQQQQQQRVLVWASSVALHPLTSKTVTQALTWFHQSTPVLVVNMQLTPQLTQHYPLGNRKCCKL